ncbi:MAG: cytochrome c biogenesis protein CcsA [Verrucomicrobia bacterium]|nr:cytochrome c biogenesis protein CcsA [Verrucomicrobiota bacterium]
MNVAAIALIACSGLAYAAGLVVYLAGRRGALERRSVALVAAGLGLHTASIAAFWIAFRQPPWATACGVLALWSWMSVVVLMVLAARRGMRVLGAFVVPAVLMMFIAAFAVPKRAFALPSGTPPLLALHIPLVFLAYTAFLYAAVAAALYLAQERRIKRKGPSAFFESIPPLEWLDRFTGGGLVAGFVVLTAGLAIGIAWLASSQVEGGLRDPKIGAVGVVWLLYGLLVAARFLGRVRGRRAAVMAVLCFLITLALFVFVRHGIPSDLDRARAAHVEGGVHGAP